MHGRDAFFVGAMGATIDIAARFHAMADDFASAMLTFRSQIMNGALEAIKVMGNAVHNDFERLIVLVAADFTSIHKPSFLVILVHRAAPLPCWPWSSDRARPLRRPLQRVFQRTSARRPQELPAPCGLHPRGPPAIVCPRAFSRRE